MERLELSLEALASELAALEDVANEGRTESDTADVQVEILCRLDTAKERMHECITTLREAREWDVSVTVILVNNKSSRNPIRLTTLFFFGILFKRHWYGIFVAD